jgi:hypothetical protein
VKVLYSVLLGQTAELDRVAVIDLVLCIGLECTASGRGRGTKERTLRKASADPASFFVVPKVQNACNVQMLES